MTFSFSTIAIPLQNLDPNGNSGVCPNSADTTISHWEISFTRNGMTVFGDFCIEGMSFDASMVCHKNGSSVVFRYVKNYVFNMSGEYDLRFVETGESIPAVKFPITFSKQFMHAMHMLMYTE